MLVMEPNGVWLLSDVTRSAPTLHHFFEPFHFLAGDQLVVPIGASHISLPLQEIQSREWEKKEQTNNMLGLTQVQKGSYVTLCICRLTLAWISSENSTTLLECQPILTGLHSLVWAPSPADSSLCCLVSTGHSRHPSPTAFRELLCPTLWPAFPSYFRSRRDLESKPFVWFRAKTDKGIVCLAEHLHSVTTSHGTCCGSCVRDYNISFWLFVLSIPSVPTLF